LEIDKKEYKKNIPFRVTFDAIG